MLIFLFWGPAFRASLALFFSGYPSFASRFPLPSARMRLFPLPLTRPPPLAPLFITRRIFLKRKRVCAFPNGSNEFFRLDLRLPFAWPRRRSTGQANLHDGAPLGIEFAADPNKL